MAEKIAERQKVTINVAQENDSFYNNILYNDDVTPVEYVVMVLQRVFRMDGAEAYLTMLYAHQHGSAIVGTFPRDEAYDHVEQVEQLNSQMGWLLQVTVEKA